MSKTKALIISVLITMLIVSVAMLFSTILI